MKGDGSNTPPGTLFTPPPGAVPRALQRQLLSNPPQVHCRLFSLLPRCHQLRSPFTPGHELALVEVHVL